MTVHTNSTCITHDILFSWTCVQTQLIYVAIKICSNPIKSDGKKIKNEIIAQRSKERQIKK